MKTIDVVVLVAFVAVRLGVELVTHDHRPWWQLAPPRVHLELAGAALLVGYVGTRAYGWPGGVALGVAVLVVTEAIGWAARRSRHRASP